MPRKKWTKQTEVTDSLLKFREKRKWQINLRRYVISQHFCPEYAPYFGLDIKNLRQWFEFQFTTNLSWDNFGSAWQFDHIIPVAYFDYSSDTDLKLCWNFTNLRLEPVQKDKVRGNRLDVLMAKAYFKNLYEKTGYTTCQQLLLKIDEIEVSEFLSTGSQESFIKSHWEYLSMIKNYNAFEFELLNSGRTVEDVNREVNFLKKFE